MGDFGLAFLQGAASSSSDTQPASLPARVASTPPINAVCDPSLFEPATGYSGTAETFGDKRTLASGPSSTSKRAKGGATGALLDMRTDALAAIKKACQARGTARTNMAARWEALCTVGHEHTAGAPREMAGWVSTCKDILAYLKADATNIRGCMDAVHCRATRTGSDTLHCQPRPGQHMHRCRSPGCGGAGQAASQGGNI